MCGIVGFLDSRRAMSGDEMEALALRMADTIAHRGPDGEGAWADAEAGLAFGHRRLAIIDLSPGGRQPMLSASGRLVITYNGEIFNYRELRAELTAAGRAFRGASDTEVMLQAIEQWGVEAAVKRFIGMFAFALWDRTTRKLTLVRDRLGIKPLYWGRVGATWFFGSQPKSFAPHPDWRGAIDRDAIAACLRFNYIPAPRSIWQGIMKLRPGHFVELAPGQEPIERCYWDLRGIARDGVRHRSTESDDEAIERLDQLLRDSVKRRMIADVPLGAFLSGGVDSSTVVALMQAQSQRPVKTFTIGFRVADYDEADHARGVAAHLGTEHTELYADPADALAFVPSLADYYDEPFADPSQIPTYLVSRLTRGHVTVSLSGDGGDELFAGYDRYRWAERLRLAIGQLPRGLRRGLSAALLSLPPTAWDKLFRLVPARRRPRLAGDRLHKLAGVLDFADADDLYWRLTALWARPQALVPGAGAVPDPAGDADLASELPDFTERMQYLDQASYLPDDILAKVDRASMAVGLEARVPLLDHRVVEYCWRLPKSMKLRGGQGKWLLRQVLRRYVPRRLIERPKMGFGVPIDAWLRGPLKGWAADLLDEKSLGQDGCFDPAPIRRRWAEHLSGRGNWQYALWGVLMVQAWRRRWA